MQEHSAGFAVTDVLRLLRERDSGTPLVLLVDPGRHNRATRYIEQGVWDVVAADQLGRLGITAHRALRERKLRVEWARMERETELARAVTHDINSLVTAVLGSCDDLERDFARNSRVRSLVEEIRRAAELSALLAGRLLSVDRRRPGVPEVLDLNEILSSMEALLRRLLGQSIELLILRDTKPLPVKAQRGQIEQVVLNLTLNAGEAMTQGGVLTVRAESVGREASSGASRRLQPGRYVKLSVSDTGCGMDETTQTRIFEPFFTTKKRARGWVRGLGLSVVQAIMKRWGGFVRVQSEPGSGTTFEVYLPQDENDIPEAGTHPASYTSQRRPGSGRTVLLVEDEPLLRQVVCRALRTFGHRVVEARDSTEAVRICEGQPIDLLLTDIVIPYMSGPELAQRLKSLQPKLKVLFMTGQARGVIPGATLHRWEWLLQKPFRPSVLAEKVHEILGIS